MLSKLRRWLLGPDTAALAADNTKLRANHEALTDALGVTYARLQSEASQKKVLAGAFALQAGGRAVIPNVFLDAVSCTNHEVTFTNLEDGSGVAIEVRVVEENGENIAS